MRRGHITGILVAVVLAMVLPLGFARAQHDHGATVKAPAEFKGDPYSLATDPVTGEKLPDKPVVYSQDGRELRFASEKNLATFNVDPAKYLAAVDEQLVKQQLHFYPLETCIVSHEKLGGDMGKPVDLIYRNRLVRLCCNSCVADFQKSPATYIAVIDKAVIASQMAHYPLTTCVVSGEKLGDMGKPVEQVVGNRLVRFCCASCLKAFDANPAKYLTQLDAKAQPPAAHGEHAH